MQQTKRSMITFGVLILLFLLGALSATDRIWSGFLLRDFSSIYFITVSLVLVLFIARCVIEKKARRYLLLIAGLIVLWFWLRVEKYVAFEEIPTAVRFLWYAYYLPILMIPQLSFSMALSMQGKSGHIRRILSVSFIVSALLLVLVMTNDVHQLLFHFPQGIEDFEQYTYGKTYYLLFAWEFLLLLMAVGLMLRKYSAFNRKLLVIPTVYSLFFLSLTVMTVLGNSPRIGDLKLGEVPEQICFLMGGLLVLCICIGLIPSNMGYGRLISGTSMAVQITDADYKVVYQSPSAVSVSEEQRKQAEPFMADENTKVFRKSVSGGFAYWQADVRELNCINRELEEVAEALSEETEILALDNELKEKQAQIEIKTKVYDDIAKRVLPQSHAIESLSAEAMEKPELFERNMASVCVYASYIKRMANLMLLASEHQTINKVELLLAMSESARYLRKKGIVADVVADFEDEMMASQTVIACYETFEQLLEQSLEELKALNVILRTEEIKLVMEGARVTLPKNVSGVVELEEQTSYVRLPLGREVPL